MAIEYKYSHMKVLVFIATGRDVSNEPGVPYLSCFPDIYSNVSVRPVVYPHLLGMYLNGCNLIDNQNSMR